MFIDKNSSKEALENFKIINNAFDSIISGKFKQDLIINTNNAYKQHYNYNSGFSNSTSYAQHAGSYYCIIINIYTVFIFHHIFRKTKCCQVK